MRMHHGVYEFYKPEGPSSLAWPDRFFPFFTKKNGKKRSGHARLSPEAVAHKRSKGATKSLRVYKIRRLIYVVLILSTL